MSFILLDGCSVKSYNFIIQNKKATKKMDRKLFYRFAEYWDAIRKKNFERSYKMELPYIQYVYDISYYKKALQNIQVKKIEVYKVEYKDPVYIITIKLGNSWQKDKWIEIDGEYYHILKDPILFPKM